MSSCLRPLVTAKDYMKMDKVCFKCLLNEASQASPRILKTCSLVELTGAALLKLDSEDLSSSFNKYLLEDILKASEDSDDEVEEEDHLETPLESPIETSSILSTSETPGDMGSSIEGQ
ncbi:hypothetical protein HAX54_014155 [Datura stramonium]|uniref:Uncharacterized protein n=1 Tax=Datura stramonium TaxID=4076 RepID=A0ABS8TMQ5_DATST|nr:hypothetical protein [Datura stramonium]